MRKTTIVNISCGLGNQLFQYAFGYAQSQRNGSKLVLYKYEDQPDHRPFQIDHYSIKKDGIIQYNNKTIIDKFVLKISKKVIDTEFCFNEGVLKQRSIIAFYNGYWQNWRYFDEYYDDLIQMFSYRNEYSEKCLVYLNKIHKEKNTLSIHIRRGDYSSSNLCINMDYYQRAFEYIKKSHNDLNIYVFSDDKEFVRKHFHVTEEYTIVEEVSDIEEFEIMRACEHHIIANSTFSWWGAYLGKNRSGIVIAPKVHNWGKEFYMPDWICIESELEK